ncbi:MAG: hypothetical protein ACQERB_11590 [Promethearchaeati archaeon]
MNNPTNNILIIDLGSYNIKAGRASKEKPKISARSLIGKSNDKSRIFICREALNELYSPKPMIEYKWDIMSIRWEDMFSFFSILFEDKLSILLNVLKNYSLILLNGVLQPKPQIKRLYSFFFINLTSKLL